MTCLLQRDCTDLGKALIASQSYQASLDYVLMAWEFVHRLPDWDNFDHNKIKVQCFKNLSSQCMSVVKKAPLEKEELRELKSK